VDSAILRIDIFKNPLPVRDEKAFFETVKAGFGARANKS